MRGPSKWIRISVRPHLSLGENPRSWYLRQRDQYDEFQFLFQFRFVPPQDPLYSPTPHRTTCRAISHIGLKIQVARSSKTHARQTGTPRYVVLSHYVSSAPDINSAGSLSREYPHHRSKVVLPCEHHSRNLRNPYHLLPLLPNQRNVVSCMPRQITPTSYRRRSVRCVSWTRRCINADPCLLSTSVAPTSGDSD